MMKLLTVAAAVMFGASLSVGAAAADPKGNTSVESKEKVADTTAATPSDQRKYCIEDTMTGSRIRHRDCRTRAEWMKDGFDPLNP